ncbi:MAG TPA: urate oxidase [Acidobacteriaceae bacterium]|jgi:urate oxidase|nr:urate oxidase [Acidobacteriaceae bacterium]
MIELGDNRYGKSRVRVMRVQRNGERHQVQEWTAEVWLKGDFQSCFEDGDNNRILPTDTMKNTVYYLARLSKAENIEGFATELVTYLLANSPQIDEAGATVVASLWGPLVGGGHVHDTAFLQVGTAHDTATAIGRRNEAMTIRSGFKDLALLKTAKSGFAGYIKDKLTTLKETHDRLLGTLASGEWTFASVAADYKAARRRIMDALLHTFAVHDSLSVQQTLFAMGKAALEAELEISDIQLSMPNKHCNLVDLSPFGLDNPNHIFVPIDEPHGSIEATLRRAD